MLEVAVQEARRQRHKSKDCGTRDIQIENYAHKIVRMDEDDEVNASTINPVSGSVR